MRFPSGLFQRPCASLLASLLFCTVLFSSVLGQDAAAPLSPMEIWRRGFLLWQSSQDDEAKGKLLESLNKLTEAQPLYDHLAQHFPDFYPEIVRERRQIIAEKRADLKTRMQSAPPAVVGIPFTSPSNPPPATSIAPPPLPGTAAASPGARQPGMTLEGDGEFTLPSWGEGASQALPRFSGPATPGVPRVQAGEVGAVAGMLYEDLSAKDELIRWLSDENQKLRTQVKQREVLLQQINQQLVRAKASQDELLRQKAALEANGGIDSQQKIENLKQLLSEATRQLEEATARNEKLVVAMEESQGELEKMKVRMEELERERDNLAEVLRGEGNSGKALKELMDRNRTLSERLNRAEQLAASLSELNKEKDNDIALLKSEITRIKVERDQLLTDNQRHQQNIADLQRKMEMLTDGLSPEDKRALASASPVERQENELLRSLVLKQLRRQAQVKQAKELLLEQLDRVGSRSDALLGLVEDMARGSQLTDEEKALFKAPQFTEILAAAEATATTISAPDAEENAPETPAAPGAAVMSATLVAAGTGKPANADPNRLVENQKLSVELSQLDKAARLDFKEGRLSEAEAGFLEYLRYMPQSVPCLCNLGVLKISMKNYSEAEYYLEKAIAIDSKSGLAHYLLGRTLFLQDKLDEALTRLETALTHDPQNAKAHNCVGVISTRKGWVARAERAFTSAVSIDPGYGDAHFNLALLHATKDEPNPQEAGKHYFRALDLGVPRDATIEDFLKQAEEAGVAVGMR